jgi:hypothetical protein
MPKEPASGEAERRWLQYFRRSKFRSETATSGTRRITFDSALTLAAVFEGLIATTAAWLFALQLEAGQRSAFIGTAVLVGGASAALGAFIGFLFGVPKALQNNKKRERSLRFVSNSNLEQISDWLTKILVGVGLIQIGELPAALSRLGDYLKPAFGNLDSSPAFAIGLVLSVFFIAFMLEYMWTRTRFLHLLEDYSDANRNRHEAPKDGCCGDPSRSDERE